MKKYSILLFIVLSFTTFAQEWHLDIDQAKNVAQKENHKIILVFQGSDWCAPCIKLDKQVWSTEEFKAYAKTNFEMVQVDFPRRKKNRLSKEQQAKNNSLAATYNPRGIFPFVVLLNKKGEKIGETGYKRMSVKEYIHHLSSL